MNSPTSITRFLVCLLFQAIPFGTTIAAEKSEARFSATDLEWFEREVRPVLAENCYSCHSSTSGTSKGGLVLDSREAILKGGDSGPAVVPGKLEESLLVEAIRRESYEMPPEKPLNKRHQKILEEWVAKGAPWPEGRKIDSSGDNWLEQRQKAHWAWKPLEKPNVPTPQNDDWSRGPIDRFILQLLQANELEPAAAASNQTLARRLSFDLTGLPAETGALSTDEEYQRQVNKLMSSPQFGVRWGRHWLDLVRYAETLGHEFDYPIHHAWQFRDAVIDSFNSDVSYTQFLREHLAGDLLDQQRLHPQSGVNQSLALTGFWFLGDSVHAPTDIQNDWALRVDNQIDVVSKTFMGMTVACARCHDHKFDAISVGDYYGLAGIAESTRRVFQLTDPQSKIAHHNWNTYRQRLEANQLASDAYSKTSTTDLKRTIKWLENVVEKFQTLDDKEKKEQLAFSHPLYLLRAVAAEDTFSAELKKLQAQVVRDNKAYEAWESASELFADFESGPPPNWRVIGVNKKSPIQLGKNPYVGPDATWWAKSRLPQFDWFSGDLPLPEKNGVFSSRRLGHKQSLTLQSARFEVTHPVICLKMRSESCDSALIIDNYFMNEVHNLLFSDTRKKGVRQLSDTGWVSHQGDLDKYVGETAYLSIEDRENGWFEIEEIRFADTPPPKQPAALSVDLSNEVIESSEQLLTEIAQAVVEAFGSSSHSAIALQRTVLREADKLQIEFDFLDQATVESLRSQTASLQKLDAATPAPTVLLAAAECDPRDSAVAIRGNPHQRGDLVPRTCFVSYSNGSKPASTSSGRLELANSLSQASHPLTARVIVNRIWHHLMGRGLVNSPDNLGVLGGRPTHPELLDYLACEFIEHDWSIKWLVHEIVSSQTYRLYSTPTEPQKELDADASLWSHRPIRRVSAESLRDAMLKAAGQLDAKLGGRSIPVHLNNQMTGRGRPGKSGPLDGLGRRSVFVEVRRNFLDPFLMAFDFPMPSTATGKRTESNVPAQALGLLNDPLVQELTKRWVALTQGIEAPSDRIQAMIQTAYGRAATENEIETCLNFVVEGGQDRWRDLAHVLINSKEFTYLR